MILVLTRATFITLHDKDSTVIICTPFNVSNSRITSAVQLTQNPLTTTSVFNQGW
jgi:hypothetical protein